MLNILIFSIKFNTSIGEDRMGASPHDLLVSERDFDSYWNNRIAEKNGVNVIVRDTQNYFTQKLMNIKSLGESKFEKQIISLQDFCLPFIKIWQDEFSYAAVTASLLKDMRSWDQNQAQYFRKMDPVLSELYKTLTQLQSFLYLRFAQIEQAAINNHANRSTQGLTNLSLESKELSEASKIVDVTSEPILKNCKDVFGKYLAALPKDKSHHLEIRYYWACIKYYKWCIEAGCFKESFEGFSTIVSDVNIPLDIKEIVHLELGELFLSGKVFAKPWEHSNNHPPELEILRNRLYALIHYIQAKNTPGAKEHRIFLLNLMFNPDNNRMNFSDPLIDPNSYKKCIEASLFSHKLANEKRISEKKPLLLDDRINVEPNISKTTDKVIDGKAAEEAQFQIPGVEAKIGADVTNMLEDPFEELSMLVEKSIQLASLAAANTEKLIVKSKKRSRYEAALSLEEDEEPGLTPTENIVVFSNVGAGSGAGSGVATVAGTGYTSAQAVVSMNTDDDNEALTQDINSNTGETLRKAKKLRKG